MRCWPWVSFCVSIDLRTGGEQGSDSECNLQSYFLEAASGGGAFRVPQLPHLTLIGNFEIHERDSLAGRLALPESPCGYTDSFLILQAYSRWGSALVDHLQGQYAFCIHDTLNRVVFACTDHLGSLPLFFAVTRRGVRLHVASDMVSMLRRFDGPIELNEATLAASVRPQDYLPPFGETFHRGIQCLREGHFFLAGPGQLSVTRYWRPSIRPELVPAKPEAAYETVRQLVERAVANRIGAKSKIAIGFSGGLDSSALAVVAAKYLRSRNQSLLALVGVNDPANSGVPDERSFAQQLDIENIELRFVSAAGQGPFDMLGDLRDLETSAGNPHSVYMPRSVTAAAEAWGSELVITGGFGEFTASAKARPLFLDLASHFQWEKLARELLRASLESGKSSLRLVASEIVHQVRPQPPGPLCCFTTPDFMRRNQPEAAESGPWGTDSRRMLLSQLTNWMGRAAMLKTAGPGRVLNSSRPFMDKNLLEFCLALPAHFKHHNGYNRYLVRGAFAKMLPDALAWRRGKMSFVPDYCFRYNAQIDIAKAFVNVIRKSDPVRDIIDVDRLKARLVPVKDPMKGDSDAFWTIPHTMRIIGFLRQFSGFRV